MGLYARMAALFLALTGLLMLVGYAIGLYFGDPLLFMLLGLVLAGGVNFVSYYWSDTIVVKMTRARIIQQGDNPALFAAVQSVAQKAGIPVPRVGIVESPQPNAFATGRGPQKAVVVATSSILQTLTPTELEAVIGHEIGHVVHRDVLTSSVAATMAGVISYIANVALYSMMFGGFNSGGNKGQGGNPLAFVAAIVLVPLGATFVRLGISRGLEYDADEYGAKLTQNPGALASALQKISAKVQTRGASPGAQGPSGSPSPATASLWIVNPFKGGNMVELFSTHPSMQHRIERLRKIGLQMGVFV